jgi:hypothetical protein
VTLSRLAPWSIGADMEAFASTSPSFFLALQTTSMLAPNLFNALELLLSVRSIRAAVPTAPNLIQMTQPLLMATAMFHRRVAVPVPARSKKQQPLLLLPTILQQIPILHPQCHKEHPKTELHHRRLRPVEPLVRSITSWEARSWPLRPLPLSCENESKQ